MENVRAEVVRNIKDAVAKNVELYQYEFYKTIKVKWQTAEMQTRIKTFTGFPAQIIQHEVDHCDGILI